jgi:hypothetical protein
MQILEIYPAYSTQVQIESHDSMATQPERIASLEAGRKGQWIALVAVATVGVGWMGWISIMLFGMKGDMQAVKQKLKDGGTGDIVSELRQPKSPDQLRASLSTVVAQVQTAKAEGKKPDEKKIAALSGAVAEVIKRDSTTPEAWQAAGELISYRSELPAQAAQIAEFSSHQPCTGQTDMDAINRLAFPKGITAGGLPVERMGDTVGLLDHDCTIQLDGKSFSHWKCLRCLVKYSGGPISMHRSTFEDCIFVFNFNAAQPPAPDGRRMGLELLASDLKKVEIPSA